MHILIIINTYGSYKEINKQYEDYNKSLVAQNEKFKEEMLRRRKKQEEKIRKRKISKNATIAKNV